MASGLKILRALCVFIAGLSRFCSADLTPEQVVDAVARLRLHSEPESWCEAQLHCLREGGTLASPINGALTQAMKSMMAANQLEPGFVLTGMHSTFIEGDFISLEGIHLSNMSLPWARGEPDNLYNTENCLALSRNGEVAGTNCVSHYPFFCYIHNPNETASLHPAASFSLSHLCLAVSVQHYKYDLRTEGWWRLHSEPATWLEAQLRCHIEGGTLASPTTVSLTSSMKRKMGQIRSVFTGIHANSSGGNFTTIDGVPLSNVHAPWAWGQPNRMCDDEDCLAMSNAGELADVSCASELPYFCYKSHATMEEDVCGTNNGYTLQPRTGSCYKFHRTGIPWHRAAMKCASERAHLAVINSEEEAFLLKSIFADNPPNTITGVYTHFAHIGFLDWNKNGNWLTVSGQSLSEAGFARWDDGEPNHVANDEHCGSVSRHGTLNDSPCVNKDMPFICEITPAP